MENQPAWQCDQDREGHVEPAWQRKWTAHSKTLLDWCMLGRTHDAENGFATTDSGFGCQQRASSVTGPNPESEPSIRASLRNPPAKSSTGNQRTDSIAWESESKPSTQIDGADFRAPFLRDDGGNLLDNCSTRTD